MAGPKSFLPSARRPPHQSEVKASMYDLETEEGIQQYADDIGDELIAWLADVERERRLRRAAERTHGFVYAIRHAETGLVKLGRTKLVRGRMASLSTHGPVIQRIELVWSVRSVRYDALEMALHQRYAIHRHHGEWYALDAECLARLPEVAAALQRQVELENNAGGGSET